MKSLNFLNKLYTKGKIQIVEQSEEISESYFLKSRDCLKSAKLLHSAELYENSIGEAYYCIYNSVMALFYKCGLKCENHSASVIMLNNFFKLNKLYEIFSKAKEERIDKQYYVIYDQTKRATKESSQEMINDADNFILEIQAYANTLSQSKVKEIRLEFESHFNKRK